MNEHLAPLFLATLVLCGVASADSSDKPPKDGIILSAPLTHSDWMMHADAPAWGDEGVRRMLEQCKACGWKRVYWRVFDAGRSLYSSKLLDPMKYDTSPAPNCLTSGDLGGVQAPADLVARAMKLDYRGFDTLAAAVKIGHELGLEVHAWMTINEDDHGWGWPSRFSTQHPEYRWVRRDGRSYHSQLSFAFPQVRAYKLALVKEILAYNVDGILLDWIRTGDIRDNPQNEAGVANYGYEAPNVAVFKNKYGVDPHDGDNGDYRWVKVRAEPITEFMRSVRAEVKKHKKVALSAMVHHRWAYRGRVEDGGAIDGSLRGILCDVRTWAREGLVDEMVAAGYYTAGGTPESGYRDLEEETEGRVPLWLYCWVPNTPDEFQHDLALARKMGARQMLFWEADYIAARPAPQREEIMKAMRKALDR